MSVTLIQILSLVGKLDDSPGADTPRERFRRYLKEQVGDVGQTRDYIEECLRNPGDRYNRALQDLTNHVGYFLGFEVTFGRYRGVPGEIGFDGHWRSVTDFHIVVEVKTTETYAIQTKVLVGYIDGLISEKRISNWDHALGLYVIGRSDSETHQIENAIVAEKRTHQLRTISVDSLLSLAETMSEYDISHQDILDILRPSGPPIDPVVDLISRVAAQRRVEKLQGKEIPDLIEGKPAYYLTPVKSDEVTTADEVIQRLVGKEHAYAFAEKTSFRKHLKAGDWMCFYATGKGVVAHAKVISRPQKKPRSGIRHPERYPWTFSLKNPQLYLDKPVILDVDLRSRLEAFKRRDMSKSWAWFVQGTSRLSPHDFKILTRQR